ncbi:hypothetical protein [Bacteriovorax sp. Seq25_V]|uniref:hypothetical protein n=1 Tax=Bacteriovorax sp. Seq25_V TaxID=1201288 RepID=UPI000389FC4F|nr:hypothetical protein [Bacteriovorax sp. Seq25_V]EQC43743.1 hypothetical protein M900_1431 [Bacteriovorax sp. Seq25_V]
MKLIPLVFALISFNSFADSFDFKCTASDLVYVNTFSMQGSLDTEDGTITYDVQTKRAGQNGAFTSLENVTRDAKFQMLRDTVTDDFMAYRALSVDQSDDHVYVNLLLNYKGKLASKIRDAKGVEYRADCEAL